MGKRKGVGPGTHAAAVAALAARKRIERTVREVEAVLASKKTFDAGSPGGWHIEIWLASSAPPVMRAKLYIKGAYLAGLDHHGFPKPGGIKVGYHWDHCPPLAGHGTRIWICHDFASIRHGLEALAAAWGVDFDPEYQVTL